jgi:PTS system mannose-specific IID component
MQNIGFAYSLIPLIGKPKEDRKKAAGIMRRHVGSFNTHPYLSAPIIGSVAKLEESCKEGNCPEALNLKKALMAPYAAMGDPFFWGGLKPLTMAIGVIMALEGMIAALLIPLLIYNMVHIWIRLKGFIEGYREGMGAVSFLNSINMPEVTIRMKWILVFFLAILEVVAISAWHLPSDYIMGITARFAIIAITILCFYLIKRGLSSLLILYGSTFLFFVMVM